VRVIAHGGFGDDFKCRRIDDGETVIVLERIKRDSFGVDCANAP
jgi:hypothetical protein